MLFALHRDFEEGVAMTAELFHAGLLDDRRIDVVRPDGGVTSVNGFRAVVEDRLAELDAETRARLERSGAMRLLEAHRSSLVNLRRLV